MCCLCAYEIVRYLNTVEDCYRLVFYATTRKKKLLSGYFGCQLSFF